jgi:hypothetical protein
MLNKYIVTLVRSVAAAVLIAGLGSASASAAVLQYFATLTGAAESPPNASPGTGNATITLDTALLTMRVQAVFSGLMGTTTASHIHCCTATPGTSTAGVATTTPTFAGFPLGVTSGTYDMTLDMTVAGSYNPAFVTAQGSIANARAALFAGLAAGTAYFNIHTGTFPGGEIRGFPAFVGPQRTFVSTGGNDANPCSLTSPCRGFAAAIAAVASGGEVIVLDSGGYGSFTIARSVTVTAPSGVYAGISVFAGSDGVVINTPGVVVTLKGLTINGQGGNSGIAFLQGSKLIVESCEIANVGGDPNAAGILVQASGGRAVVRDTIIRDMLNFGIWVMQPGGVQTATLVADNVALHNANSHSIYVGGGGGSGAAEAYLSHVTVTGSSLTGIAANTAFGGPAFVSVTNSTISSNAIGVLSTGTGAKVTVATSTIVKNAGVGLSQASSATLLSRGDNTIDDNNGGGAQTTGTIGPMPPL